MNKKLLFLVCFGFNYAAIISVPPTPEFIERSQKPVEKIRYTSELNFYHWWRNREDISPILEELNKITRFIRASEKKFHKIPQVLNQIILDFLSIFHDRVFTTMKRISLDKWPIKALKDLKIKLGEVNESAKNFTTFKSQEQEIILCIYTLYYESIKFFNQIINKIKTVRNRIESEQQEGQYGYKAPEKKSKHDDSYFNHDKYWFNSTY